MHPNSSAPRLSPTAPAERVAFLDVLRGFALAGIALVNVEFFSRPLQDLGEPGVDPSSRGADRLIEWLTALFLQGKFWTLFALLFGIGFALAIERARWAGRPFAPAYLRRVLALAGIGLVHAVLIWSGDILLSYAAGALLLLVAHQVRGAGAGRPPMTTDRLAGWGAALYSLPIMLFLLAGLAASLAGGMGIESPEPTEPPAYSATQARLRTQALAAYGHGSFAQATAQRIDDTIWQLWMWPTLMFLILGLFLLGMALVRSGLLHEPLAHSRLLRRTRDVGLPLGLMGGVIALWLDAGANAPVTFASAVQVALFLASSLLLALAYAAAVLLALQGTSGEWLRRWLAPMGRMALTHYLLQSLVGTLLFYGYGLGLWGTVGRAWQAVGVLGLLVLQALASRWWLARYRFGPVEWAWRCITYARFIPLRAT